jgi:hypothetical protein
MEQKLSNQAAWLESLINGSNFNGDLDSVKQRIIENRKYFQHERLIHLLVTLGIALIIMIILNIMVTRTDWIFGILLLILAVLEFFYIRHYFRLEQGGQKLWDLEQIILMRKNG